MKKICAFCNKEFEAKDKRFKYCSTECKEKANAGICIICGKPTQNHNKTCSAKCKSVLQAQINSDPERVKQTTEKIKRTKQERYGDPNYNNIEKTRRTNLQKYGCEIYMHSKEGTEKVKSTMLKRYGVEHALQSPDLLKKMEKTVEKNGISYRFHTPERNAVMISKYGTTVPYKNEDIKRKGIQKLIERYGVSSPTKLDWVQEKSKKSCLQKYGVEYSFQSDNNKRKSELTCQKKYGMSMADLIHKRVKKSKINLEFAEFLEIPECDMEFSLDGKFFDLKKDNILIEIDPTVSHNSDKNIFTKGGKTLDKNYHLNKSKIATNNGYRCIHVFDRDNPEKIKMLIQYKNVSIGARKCDVAFIDKETADEFLDTYHLQGSCSNDFARVGLIYDDSLIGVMTFGVPRYNNQCQVELLRLCFADINVVGGAKKMFDFFLNNYHPDSIVSYCDLSKFRGNVYSTLGFTLQHRSQPSAHRYNMRTKQHITDNLLRQQGFDHLFNTNYGKGTSNEQLMLEHGFLRVYDCGQATYIWSNITNEFKVC